MASSFEKSVKGGTKVKLAPPKSKYVEHILIATQSEAGVAEVFRTLTHRLRDSTWTVAFKSLILVHLMIKEGTKDTTLSYLSAAPTHRLAVNTFTDVQTQGHNIRQYSSYLITRARAFQSTKCDYVRVTDGRLKRLTVDKGLLRETEAVQEQIKALVKCDLLTNDAENEISLTAFRLLTRDLLDLFNIENEAVMNVLSHYFEMSRPDAERAIRIYKNFCKQTDQVVQYLSVARQHEHATRLEIPKIKHAPTSLVASLQEYLDDKDFEINRRQYLAEQEAKKVGKPFSKPAAAAAATAAPSQATTRNAPVASNPFANLGTSTANTSQTPANKGPAPDLIDFFESIEQNQQPMAQQSQAQAQAPDWFAQVPQAPYQQPQQTAFPQQQAPLPQQQPVAADPWGQQQAAYPQQQPAPTGQWPLQTQQLQQQYNPGPQYASPPVQSPIQQQTTGMNGSNPFRQSMMPTGSMDSYVSNNTQALSRQPTNPFAKPIQQVQSPIQAQPTGTNPFARNIAPQPQQQQPTGALQTQPTGSTNPFRQSMFVNQQTGQGWQQGPQATMGGLEGLETVPVFPRPGQAPTQQNSPWN